MTTSLPDESVEIPDCDCYGDTTPRERLHKPGCPRMAAIIRKWHGPEAERIYLKGACA